MKTPFTIADGPLAGCSPSNTLFIDSSLIGVEPTAGDKRFLIQWKRATGTAAGLYKFVRDGGVVKAVHVPGADDQMLPTAEELQKRAADAAVAQVMSLAEKHPEVQELLK